MPAKRRPWSHDGRSRHARGYGAAWEKARAAALARDQHLCQHCLQGGRVTPAASVHHITRKADGGTDDLANLVALCAPCHETADAKARGFAPAPRQTIGADGWPEG